MFGRVITKGQPFISPCAETCGIAAITCASTLAKHTDHRAEKKRYTHLCLSNISFQSRYLFNPAYRNGAGPPAGGYWHRGI